MRTLFVVGLCVFALAAAVPALAQPAPPSNTSDVFILSAPTGGTASVITLPEGTAESPVPVDTGIPGNPAEGVLLLMESGSANSQVISDVVGVLAQTGNIGVMSDVDEVGGIPLSVISTFFMTTTAPPTEIPEPPAPVDITKFIAPGAFAGYTATFQSDFETPEPSTFALLAAGGAGLVACRWRRRKAA